MTFWLVELINQKGKYHPRYRWLAATPSGSTNEHSIKREQDDVRKWILTQKLFGDLREEVKDYELTFEIVEFDDNFVAELN